MKRIAIDLLVLAAIIVAASIFISFQATRRFDFYDMSAFLDAGYRVWRGQKIYVDFFYIAGPVHLYVHAFFFSMFGFTKRAVLAYLCATQAVSLTCAYFLARRALNVLWSACLAILVSLSMFGPIAHPWYDQTAMMFFLLASIPFVWAYPFSSFCRTWLLPALGGGLMALSFLTKANVGLSAGGLMLIGYAIIGKEARNYRPLIAYFVGGVAVLSVIISRLPSPAAYVQQNFFAFRTSERFLDYSRMYELLEKQPYIELAIGGAVLICLGGYQWNRKNLPEVLILGITWIAGLFSAWTGSILTLAYTFFIGIILLFICLLVGRLDQGTAPSLENRFYRTARVGSWIAIAVLINFSAERILSVWTWEQNDFNSVYALKTPAFAGWKCNPLLGQGVDSAVDVIHDLVPAGDSLLIFPDCQIIYGLAGRDSYRKVPWAFNLDNSPGSSGKMRDDMVAHFKSNPPDWILYRDERLVRILVPDAIMHQLGLLDIIKNDYVEVQKWNNFRLLHRKPEVKSLQ